MTNPFIRTVAIFYIVFSILLLPWMFRLSSKLPDRYLGTNWKTVWVGFDFGLALLLLTTGLLVLKNSVWAVISGSALSALLVADVWFDTLLTRTKRDRRISVLTGALIELPLAILTIAIIVMYLRTHLQ